MLVNLDSEKFGTFMRVLSIFKDLCNDVDIRDGVIRQKTNDSVSVFELDLNYLLDGISLPICNVKQKLELFKCFIGQEVIIENDEDCFKFSDQYSTLQFKNPHFDFMDNKFITEDEIGRVISVPEEQLLLNTSIGKVISDRIKVITSGFQVNNLSVNFDGETATITSLNLSKDQSAVFLKDITTEQVVILNTNLTTIPFIVDHDNDILFRMYEIDETKALNKFATTISDINVNIYCRSQITRDEKGEE